MQHKKKRSANWSTLHQSIIHVNPKPNRPLYFLSPFLTKLGQPKIETTPHKTGFETALVVASPSMSTHILPSHHSKILLVQVVGGTTSMNSLGPLDIQLLYTVKTLQNDGLEKINYCWVRRNKAWYKRYVVVGKKQSVRTGYRRNLFLPLTLWI